MGTTIPDTHDRRIGIKPVEDLTGLHRSSIWARLNKDKKDGTPGVRFPVPIFIGEKRMWLESEIRAWVAGQAARPASERKLPSRLGAHAQPKPAA